MKRYSYGERDYAFGQARQKLTAEQREEAFLLLEGGMSLGGVAKRFGVNPESLRRLLKRHAS